MINILPYPLIVGQTELRRSLEMGYVGRLGVLATGQRGTAKSTTIRSFCLLMYDQLPVTLPIGVTDDRVLGGWSIDALLGPDPEPRWQDGLLAQAAGTGVLYIDEINLLDDHIVNLVLDAAATGIVAVQRDNADRPTRQLDFSLVGSMNPEEGPLRPQLLDRFALVVDVEEQGDAETRRQILHNLLRYETSRDEPDSPLMQQAAADGRRIRQRLTEARAAFPRVTCSPEIVDACARVAEALKLVGHRGELVMIRAARASAALYGHSTVELGDLAEVAKLALVHRRPSLDHGPMQPWQPDDQALLEKVLTGEAREPR